MDGEYNILIVDDNPSNRYLLEECVVKFGFKSITANGGKAALEILAREKIDAILLDIMMPDMNGWLVLNSMKKNPETSGIPVIMVSALDDVKNIVSCLEAGADDYISKPFSPEILKARLRNCLERKALTSQIEKNNALLESKVEEKTKELAEAYEKLQKLDRAKADFMRIIAHELRTPLTGIQASAELLFEESEKENKELVKAFRDSYERMDKLIEQAILISKLDLGGNIELQDCNLEDIIMTGLSESHQGHEHLKSVSSKEINGKCRCNLSLMTCAFKEIFEFCVNLGTEEKGVILTNPEPGLLEITIKNIDRKKYEGIYMAFETNIQIRTEEIKDVAGIDLGPLIASKILNIFSGSISLRRSGNNAILAIKVPVV